MMLAWAAEQPTEITTTAIDLEFLTSATNVDRGVLNLEFVLQQMHTALMALTSHEPNDIVANSRKNPLLAWRRLQERYDPTTGGRKRNLLRTIISPGRCSLQELQVVIERWESYVSRYEKKMKDKLDDEIKLAVLESLVPEELEKHLIENSFVIWCSMSHPLLFSHLPFTTSTSSSSFTHPSTTQEHAAQSVQQEQLREHPVHHAHLQAPSVEPAEWRKPAHNNSHTKRL